MPLKRSIFTVIILLSSALITEGMAYLVWQFKFDSGSKAYLQDYVDRKRSISKITVNTDRNLIGYEAGTTVVAFNREFTDRYKVWFDDKLGISLFDDGVQKEKKFKGIVVGDSFARGVGAGSILANWVELVEKNLGDVDLLNIAGNGDGGAAYRRNYHRVADLHEHQFVIVSYYLGNDFWDTLREDSRQSLILDAEGDLRESVKSYLYANSYDTGCERLARKPFELFTIKVVIQVLRERYNWARTAFRKFLQPCPAGHEAVKPNWVHDRLARYQKVKKERDKRFFQAIDALFTDAKMFPDKVRPVQENILLSGRLYYISDYDLNRLLADRLAQFSAKAINRFYRELSDEGKRMIVIFHPSKTRFKEKELKKYFPNLDTSYAKDQLAGYLNPKISVIDLMQKLKLYPKAERLYWKIDGHYTPEGYSTVSEIISRDLKNIIQQIELP